MATITNPPAESSGAHAAVQEPLAYERFIEDQLRTTRRQVRAVDLASNLLGLAACLLGYVLVLLVVDHWLVPGGVPAWLRVLVWVAAVGGGLGWTFVCVWPLLVRRINPVFAARTIERSEPRLKNSLVNFLLLRRSPEALPSLVYHAVGEQAAERLATVPIETVVDRTRVIRLLWVLVAVFVALGLAAIGLLVEGSTPSHLFRSVGRVVAPWAEIAPPTRVAISDVQPGNTSVYQGERVRVSAWVRRLREGEQVVLHYSTADGQVRDQQIVMQRLAETFRYQAELPPTGPGLTHDATYWITAGDASTEVYKVRALTAPAIVVERVEYRYPRYTELEPRTVVRQGDVQGIEGTLVTIQATANQEIKTAMLDFECDGRRDLTMHAEGRTAWVQFRLSWDEAAGRPRHTSYQVRFTNGQGHENPHPVRYKIDCFRDEPPVVSFDKPDTPPDHELVLELGQALPLVVTAADPDYKLSSVLVRFERAGELVHEEPLLIDGPRAGSYRRSWLFQSGRYNLKEGDVVHFWAEARDNRQPDDDRPADPNVAATPKYRLRILARQPQEQPRDQPEQQPNEARQGQPKDQQPGRQGAQRPDQPQPNQPQQGQPEADQPPQGDPQAQPQENGAQQNQPRRQPQEAQPPGQGHDQQQNGEQQAGEQDGQAQQGGQQGRPPMQGQPQGQPSADQPGGAEGEGQQPGGEEVAGQQAQQPSQDRQPTDGQQGQRQGQPSPQNGPREPIDPDSDPGRAIEEILKHRQQQKQDQDQPAGQQPQQGQPQQGQPQRGPSEQGAEPSGQPQQASGDQQQPADQRAGAAPGNEGQPADQQAPTQGQPGDQPGQNRQPGQDLQPGDAPGDEQAAPGPEQQADQQGSKTARQDKAGSKGKGSRQAGGQAQPGEQPEKDGQTPNPGESGDQPDAQPAQAAREGDDQGKPPQSGKGGKGKGGDAQGNGQRPNLPQGEKQCQCEGECQGQCQGGAGAGSDSESPDRGSPGAGRRGSQPQGSPAPQEGNFDRQKHANDQEGSPDAESEAQSPSTSRRQSDAEGGQAGDRSGAGGQGGGQRSPTQGTGSAGQNTASDDGGGQANQKGQGPTAESGGDSDTTGTSQDGSGSKVRQPGGKKQAGGQKGGAQAGGQQQAGQQSGPRQGDSDANGQTGDSPQQAPQQSQGRQQNKAGQSQGGQQAQDQGEQSGQSEGGDQQQSGGQANGSANPQGQRGQPGSQPGDGTASPGGGPSNGTAGDAPPPSVPRGDDPNLDYARRATDLALEYLKDQLAKEQPDQELLDRLGWTREDMQRFVDRWEALKRAAEQPGEEGKQAQVELDELLRSLGLRPQGAALAGGTGEGTRVRDTREGMRSDPPSAYAEKYRAFTRGKKRRAEKQESPP